MDELHFLMGRGPLINVFLRVYFDVFGQCSRFLALKNRVRSMFLELLKIVEGGGTPVNRISEGLF